MIVDVKDKKLVFGMTWRRILGSGQLKAQAANIAKELKSDRIWYDGRSAIVGVATAEDASTKIKETLYAGAIALANGVRKGLSTLFVYRMPDSDEYIVCGIIKGKPQAAFDSILSTESEVAQRVTDFAHRCAGSFALAGNVDGLRILIEESREIDVLPMDLSSIALSAQDGARLHSAKVKGITPTTVFRGACVLAIFVAGYVALAPRLTGFNIPFFHHEAPPKSAQQIYDEALAPVLDTPVLPVSMLSTWETWWSAQPFVVGGWVESEVKCNAKAMPMVCTFTYKPNSLWATNLSFQQAKPASWPQPRYTPDGKTVLVILRVPGLRQSRISDMRKYAPTVNDLALQLGSILQEVKPIADRTNNGTPQVFPAGSDPTTLTNALYTSTWAVSGPLRNVDVLAQLPNYTTITDLHLAVNLEAAPKANQSKLTLDVSGLSFSRK